MATNSNLDMERICRVCLHENVELFLLHDGNYALDGVLISQILTECTIYKVQRYDELPHQICDACMEAAKNAYSFKKRTEQSYRQLMELVDDVSYKEQMGDGKSVEQSTQTDKLSMFPCELCDEKFYDFNDLRDHRLGAHRGDVKRCKICSKEFHSLYKLKSHLALHHGQEGMVHDAQCNVCGKQFSRKDHMRRHMHNVHKLVKVQSKKVIARSLEEPEIDINKSVVKPKAQPDLLKFMQNDTSQHSAANKSVAIDALQPMETHVKDDIKLAYASSDEASLINETHWHNEIEADSDGDNNSDVDGVDVPNPLATDNVDAAEADNSFASLKEDLVKVEPDEAEMSFESHIISEVLKSENKTDRQTDLLETDKEAAKSDDEDEAHDEDYAGNNQDNDEEDEDDRPLKERLQKEKRKTTIVRAYLQKSKTRQSTIRYKDNKCPECERVFTRHCHLRRHMLTHSAEKPYECEHCAKRFTRRDHLKNHMDSLHLEKQYKCDQCEMDFSRKDALARHKDSKHSGGTNLNKVHPCDFCEKSFTSKNYLRKHRLMHTDRIFACKHCEETFKDRAEFREHEKKHTATERNFLCSICGDSFLRNDYLMVHMRRHTGEKPYKCQFCGKGFPRATDVKVHERYHTGHKPNLCTLCGKGFHRAYNLTIHMRTHTGERPFQCEHCPKSFAQSNDLKAHVRRHTGERFKCTACDASFLQLYGLRQHALAAHGIQIDSITGRLQKYPVLPVSQDVAAASLVQQQLPTLPLLQELQGLQGLHDLQAQALQQQQFGVGAFLKPPERMQTK